MHSFLRKMCYWICRSDAGKTHQEWRTNSWLTSRFWSTVKSTSVISQYDGLITKGPMIWCRMVGWLKLRKRWELHTTSWTYLRHGEQSWQHVMKVFGKFTLGDFSEGFFFTFAFCCCYCTFTDNLKWDKPRICNKSRSEIEWSLVYGRFKLYAKSDRELD